MHWSYLFILFYFISSYALVLLFILFYLISSYALILFIYFILFNLQLCTSPIYLFYFI